MSNMKNKNLQVSSNFFCKGPVTALLFISLAIFAGLSLAQPYKGDLDIYEGSFAGSSTTQPNLLFIADTSNSMDYYVAVEYNLTKDAYDPTFDYGADGAAVDDSYIYVYDDLETFSGVTITSAQNRCDALTTTHINSPNFPLFTDKVLQWKPIATDGEWSGTLETSSDSAYILECEEDAGIHGISSGSTDVEAAFCGSASCTSPRYVPSNGIDWTSEGLSDRLFYTGNYHDYLDYTPPTPDRVFDFRATTHIQSRHKGSWSTSTSHDNVESFCNLINFYGRFAFDKDDPSTWSVVTHPPTTTDLYVQDSEDGNNVIYVCKQKRQAMIDAMTDMVTSISGVNIGLMRFNHYGYEGGSVIYHVQDIDDTTNRSALLSKITALPSLGYTPLSETLYEAYLYFQGENEKASVSSIADSDAFSRASKYESPITHSCQSNNIIYLSDGEPSNDVDLETEIESVVGNCYESSRGSNSVSSNSCLDDLAEEMATVDMSDLEGKSTVTTYTVGFDIDLELLDVTAIKGGGKYYTAESYDDLTAAFQDILLNIAISESSTLVAPAVSVNAFNELRHRNQIYFATFSPAYNPAWEGNVKKYGLTGDAIIYGQAGPGVPVIGTDGFFTSSSQSYWSDFPDGPIVEEGGYRGQLTNNRKVYIQESILDGKDSDDTDIVLLTRSSTLDPAKLNSTPVSASEAGELRDWLLGIDVDDYDNDGDFTDAHQYGADSLHSRPFVITYSGTSEADARDILFISTNMGSIRAIDARDSSGKELWSYQLPELVENVKKYRENSAAFRHWHAYGLDGEATIWTEEASGGSAGSFNLDTAYMFQGMRRGGKDYFAWNISNADMELRANPISQEWKISGGTGDFADLGYTWSKMVRTKMRWSCDNVSSNDGCKTKEVLVFSGGYDEHYDTSTVLQTAPNPDIDGDAVFIVDALTGGLLWSAGNHTGHTLSKTPTSSDTAELPMYDSIPTDPSPIDIDGDGDMDMLFVIDISGKIFRFDFDQTNSDTGAKYASGGVIANLRDGTNIRRFYNGLDVSFIAPQGETPYFTLAVGSGYRAGPKDPEVWANRFYVVLDENLVAPELVDVKDTPDNLDDDKPTYEYKKTYDTDGKVTSRAVITHSDLYALTSSGFEKGTNGDHGFYRSFDNTIYEKVLQESSTFAGNIFVSTYAPVSSTSAAGACGVSAIGSGRVYRFSLKTGLSTLEDGVNGIVLERPGIPPSIVWLVQDKGISACIGTLCTSESTSVPVNSLDGVLPGSILGVAKRAYWQEQSN